VLLHFAEGSLSLLEVAWYNFPHPIPSVWTEITRVVLVGLMSSLAGVEERERAQHEGKSNSMAAKASLTWGEA